MKKRIDLEVCCNSLNSAIAAANGGANRIELCDNLLEGGTTPSLSAIRMVRELIQIPIHILIRPRGGDFLYSPLEINQILLDIQCCAELGIDGVVIGALNEDGDLDRENFKRIQGAIGGGMSVTFHRALDMARDPLALIEELHELKVDRVLTSGCSSNLKDGIPMLARMQEAASGKIKLMAGGGITSKNVSDLIRQTNVREIHISGKAYTPSRMKHINTGVSMSDNDSFKEFEILETQEQIVRDMVSALNQVF